MFAEVISGRFKSKGGDAAGTRYALPTSARIGLRALDEAHAALLARLNAAYRALAAGDEARARLQLEALRSDMATHFDIEEQIMQALGFDGMRDHVRRHAASAADLDEICRTSLARGTLRADDLDRCFQALVDEILRGDVDLKSHFQSMDRTRPIQQRGA